MRKNACGVSTGAKKYKNIEKSIECLLEGGGGRARSNGERNEQKKTTPDESPGGVQTLGGLPVHSSCGPRFRFGLGFGSCGSFSVSFTKTETEPEPSRGSAERLVRFHSGSRKTHFYQ